MRFSEKIFQEYCTQILSPTEYTVLIMRFGLCGERAHTIGEMADSLGITGRLVREIERKALETIKYDPQSQGKKELIDPRYYNLSMQEAHGNS